MTTDGELVRHTLRGDRAACEELVGRWSARVLALCHARIGNRHQAEDLAQESLLRAVRGLNTLDQPEKFGSWLYGIAARVCLDWRKAKQSSQVAFSVLANDAWPDILIATDHDLATQEIDRADEFHGLMREVESLPEKHREVLMLFYYDEMSYQAMAELLGVSSATINARLTQARAMLRERLNSRQG